MEKYEKPQMKVVEFEMENVLSLSDADGCSVVLSTPCLTDFIDDEDEVW